MTYEILDHPADVRFRAIGSSLEAAVTEVVNAVSDIVGGGQGTKRYTIDVEAEDLEALLFDFLSQLILIQDIEDAVVSHSDSCKIGPSDDGFHLRAEICLAPIPVDKPVFDIKAPTYSDMKIESNDQWVIEATLDV